MSSRFNLWDILIGVGYGIVGTMLVLRFIDAIPHEISVWGQLLFLPTIGLQLYRQLRQDSAMKVEHQEGANG